MANYKPYGYSLAGFGGIAKYLNSSETPICLHYDNSSGTDAKSIHDNANNNYQVPTGKIFVLLGTKILSGTATIGSTQLVDATTADSVTGSTFAYHYNFGLGETEQAFNKEIIADHYLNFKAGAAGVARTIQAIGYEKNA